MKIHIEMTIRKAFRLLFIFILQTAMCMGCRSIEADLIFLGKSAAGDIEWKVKDCRGGGCRLIMQGSEHYIMYVAPLDNSTAIPDSELVVGSEWHLTGIAKIDSGSQENGMYWAEVWFLKYESFKRISPAKP